MKIAILGTGCAKCRQTEDVVRRAVEQSGAEAAIRKVEDIREIMTYRVMATPAVAVDGKVVVSGRVPTVDEIKAFLSNGDTA